MESISAANPTPKTFTEKAHDFVDNYFNLKNASMLETALKVISYVTIIIPLLIYFIQQCTTEPIAIASPVIEPKIDEDILAVLNDTPQFTRYTIGRAVDPNGFSLTAAHIRPANLFYDAILGQGQTVLPGRGLFKINMNHDEVRRRLDEDREFTITARGDRACQINNGRAVPLARIYGENEFKITAAEIRTVLDSQKVYTSLPIAFYSGLKRAMQDDEIVILPGRDRAPIRLRNLENDHCMAFINQVRENPQDFGFESAEQMNQILDLTLYQLGSLVVKTEDYYLLTNPDGTIRRRNPGDQDAFRLINACGIRGIHHTEEIDISNRAIMTQGFSTALQSAESGFVVFPAVGMGVWRGDPNLYWRAFLDAVIAKGEGLEKIFINPGHQTTRLGVFSGHSGDEFQIILDEYKNEHADNPVSMANLNKIINLFHRKTDLVHLSQKLKLAFPDKIISLFNASDPDVTLGYHVGEYVNNIGHTYTTEENYTALGTNGLCFETITKVHENPIRLIQV